MGNATGGGSNDVTKSYDVEMNSSMGVKLPTNLTTSGSNFTIVQGVRKKDKEPVLIFRCDKKTGTSGGGLASNTLLNAKRLRHPLLLNYIDGMETDNDVFLVTEDAVPLSIYMRYGPAKLEMNEIAWGIRCIANALQFLNEEICIVHGNVTCDSIYVTPSGDWKLFGTELLDSELKNDLSHLIKQCTFVPDNVLFKCPERRSNKYYAGPTWSYDAWSLGCVVGEVFHPNLQKIRQEPDISNVPEKLKQHVQQLLAANAKDRLKPSEFAKNDFFVNNIYVKSMNFLNEVMIKPVEKKDAFFKSFIERIAQFPKPVLKHKLLPIISNLISLDSKAILNFATHQQQPTQTATGSVVLAAQPPQTNLIVCIDVLLAIASVFSNENNQNNAKDEACWVLLFQCNDRNVRVTLLQKIDKIVPLITQKTINSTVFDCVCTGFGDSTPIIRELTIKSVLPLIGKLDDNNKNDKLLRFLAKLQTDPENAIRTNATVCLGLIASHLSPDIRKKTLAGAFIRALKDPFLHCRIAGLKALGSTHKLYLDSESIACRVLPFVCPLLVDPSKDCQAVAFETMNILLNYVKEIMENPNQQQQNLANQTNGEATSLASGMMSKVFGGWSTAVTPPPVVVASTPSNKTQQQQTTVMVVNKKPIDTNGAGWGDEDDDDQDDFGGGKGKKTNSFAAPEEDDFFQSTKNNNNPHTAKVPMVTQSVSANSNNSNPMPYSSTGGGGGGLVVKGGKKKKEEDLLDLDLLSDDFATIASKTRMQSGVVSATTTSNTTNAAASNVNKTISNNEDFFAALMQQPNQPKKR